MPTLQLGPEPVAIIGTADACLIAVQAVALNIPSGVHAAIAAAVVILGVILARAGVTPVTADPPRR
jgi:hypothetical protein